MKSRPEKIAVVVYVITVAFFSLAGLVYFTVSDRTDDATISLLIAVGLILFGANLLVRTLTRFLLLLLFQIAVIEALVIRLQAISPLANVILVLAFVLNTSIRLHVRYSAPLNVFVAALPLVSAVRSGAFRDHELLVVAALEAVFVGFAGVVIYYREKLIDVAGERDHHRKVLRNVSAANESFVEHLPEMKRESAEQERLRITRELHDSLGYAMTNIVTIMSAAQYLFTKDPDKVRHYCLKTKELASNAMADTRSTLYRLRAVGQETPMNPAIFFHRFCRDFQEATGICTECHSGNLTLQLSGRVFNTLLRTIQVGFINALRHGKASNIRLHFWVGDRELRMTIWNSTDITRPDVDHDEGIGLQGVRERISELGGDMQRGYTSDGYRLTISIPKKELRYGSHAGIDC